jgi:hypothetical protein
MQFGSLIEGGHAAPAKIRSALAAGAWRRGSVPARPKFDCAPRGCQNACAGRYLVDADRGSAGLIAMHNWLWMREVSPEAGLCWREFASVAKTLVDGHGLTKTGLRRNIALRMIDVLKDWADVREPGAGFAPPIRRSGERSR